VIYSIIENQHGYVFKNRSDFRRLKEKGERRVSRQEAVKFFGEDNVREAEKNVQEDNWSYNMIVQAGLFGDQRYS
jgi:hypothetical protein